MNSIFLMGGLGNQLFQIYTLISYCLENKKPFNFLYSETLNFGIERPTYWDNFLQRIQGFTTTDTSIYQLPIYKEKSFSYNKIQNKDTNVLLYGYFQSYKYFENNFESINKMIGLENLKQIIKRENKDLLNKEENQLLISLHFRLGDYKVKQDYHPIMSLEYYIDSLKYIINNNVNKKIKVLYFCEKSDNNVVENNIQYIKKHFDKININYVKINDSIEDWKQMLIMSLCDCNIIANSTFSWWGAYYNNNNDKIICYPKLWFGKACKDINNVEDLFPKHWIKI